MKLCCRQKEFEDVLSEIPGRTIIMVMRIDVGYSKPISQVPHRLPENIQEKVRDDIRVLEEAGIIVKMSSSRSSPVVPVRKPDGSIRLSVDCRKLNTVTKQDPWYMPILEEVVSAIGNCRVVSKLDLVCNPASPVHLLTSHLQQWTF